MIIEISDINLFAVLHTQYSCFKSLFFATARLGKNRLRFNIRAEWRISVENVCSSNYNDKKKCQLNLFEYFFKDKKTVKNYPWNKKWSWVQNAPHCQDLLKNHRFSLLDLYGICLYICLFASKHYLKYLSFWEVLPVLIGRYFYNFFH